MVPDMKPRILLVDDDAEFVELAEYNLRKQGCDVLTAGTGLQGLNLARTESPEVILLDLMLPDLDGFVVCEILSRQPSTRDIPVLVVSALDGSTAATRKSKVRPAGFFRKPVDFKLLGESIWVAAEDRQALLHWKTAAKDN